MIKFWKSAGKDKSICPARTPEDPAKADCLNETQSFCYTLEPIPEIEDSSEIFEKKSRLSLTFTDVVTDCNSLGYFLQYMESVGAFLLIKCWLEIEQFKSCIENTPNHSKIARTKSFDLGDNKIREHAHISRRHSYRFDTNFSTEKHNEINSVECNDTNCTDCQNHNFKKHLTDAAVNIFKKYVALEAPYNLDLPDNVRKVVISNICHPDGIVDKDCFKPAQDIVFSQLETTYFENFQKSPLYVKAQIDVLTNGSLKLQDILYNEMILFYFTEYLEQESATILLEFLMTVMNFSDNLKCCEKYDSDQVQDDAIILYDKYFSLQATSPVGFPSEVRLKVEENICREGGPLPDCFEIPLQIVIKTLSRYAKNFLNSELYYKYLSEMLRSVSESWRTHKKSHSDCSSEYSLSTQNTLLAMGDPVFRKKKRNHSVPDMSIDSNQLYNADSLWQRKRHEGLSLGRINSLGRFESKFEPDPDKKQKSVLKKMVSRFVANTSARVEEEMAEQIAHMIVKDVTDLTMAPPESSNSA